MLRKVFKKCNFLRSEGKKGPEAKSALKTERIHDIREKYGKHAHLFEHRILGHKKYDDVYDKHKQIIGFSVVEKKTPTFVPHSFIAPCATLSGGVDVWQFSTIWYGVVIRSENFPVQIGSYVNIQDGSIITDAREKLNHDHDGSTIIGHNTSIGHGCVIHGATIGEGCLVGMKSLLSEGSVMESGSMLGANSVLQTNQVVPSGELWAGSPARFIRKLTSKEMEKIVVNSKLYFQVGQSHLDELFLPIGTNYLEVEKINPNIGVDVREYE